MIIDASQAIVGRLAATAAKAALEGEDVIIIHIEKAVLSGDPKAIVERYMKRRRIQNKANPDQSTKWPKREDYLFKRIVRGMLPKHSERGTQALKRVMAYRGAPSEYAGKAKRFKAVSDSLTCRFISLEELCTRI
ncbi:50S ribosomal protein L13 [Candidatus Micrarchaeota archaeon]|nr:50S ribosomal protein L13 [Candidatus Micrarchaeota archaeon]